VVEEPRIVSAQDPRPTHRIDVGVMLHLELRHDVEPGERGLIDSAVERCIELPDPAPRNDRRGGEQPDPVDRARCEERRDKQHLSRAR
jgi:hypothetical protein